MWTKGPIAIWTCLFHLIMAVLLVSCSALTCVSTGIKGIMCTNYRCTIGQIKNISSTIGQNATFECAFPGKLRNLDVGWFHRHSVLAINDIVVTRNRRISVQSNENTKTFLLTIQDIREEDQGNYSCQISHVPTCRKTGHLIVNDILEIEHKLNETQVVDNDETNFTISEMGNESSNKNKATSHLVSCWPIVISLTLFQLVFAFAY